MEDRRCTLGLQAGWSWCSSLKPARRQAGRGLPGRRGGHGAPMVASVADSERLRAGLAEVPLDEVLTAAVVPVGADRCLCRSVEESREYVSVCANVGPRLLGR